MHGALLPIRYADHGQAELGLAKIATLVRKVKATSRNVLFIDNGDLIQGTPLAYHHARIDPEPADPMVTALGIIGCDAAVVGNHEFNYGIETLRKAMRESRFPWLSANIINESTGEPAFGKPYVVKELESGLRVGILGLTTPYIPNWEQPQHIAGLAFLDAVEAANRWIPVLKGQERVDVVIVAYHGGFERDPATGQPTEPPTGENQGYRLCMEAAGIDVLLTGHQHRHMAGIEVNGVTVVQPGTAGDVLSKVTVRLERRERSANVGGSPSMWRTVEKKSELLSVEGVEADPEIIRMAQPYERDTQRWLDTPIGRIEGEMSIQDPMAVRLKDHPLIEFINRVQMEVSGASISNTALFDNAAPGFPSHVTMRHVVTNYIYPNTLKVIRVSGQDIRDALEQSAGYFSVGEQGEIIVSKHYLEPKPQHYHYDMWEGIAYKLNISRPVGQRVVELKYRGTDLDPSQEYDVAMNHYRAAGGGNYAMFKDKPVVKDIPIPIAELIATYILEKQTITASVDGNWEVIVINRIAANNVIHRR